MLRTFNRLRCPLKWPRLAWPIQPKQYSTTTQSPLTSTFDDDMPVEMEDPFTPAPNRCLLCGVRIDYKNPQLLSQFVSSYTGTPVSQKASGLCDKKYRKVMETIKISRMAGYMAHRTKDSAFFEDPDITGSAINLKNERLSNIAKHKTLASPGPQDSTDS